MGVHQLWSILEPVKQEKNVACLVGKTLCVDLSGWICEAQCAKGLKASVNKPHLRNIFFRVVNLTRHGVRLVFVVDGKPPEIKWEAMAKRVQSRYGTTLHKAAKSKGQKKIGRSNFTVWVNECKTLLKQLGVPCVESPGEAEAMCAWMDYNQIVDGCITNDGDAFLYGARTVYKDFAVSVKDSFLECYKMEDIEAQLGLNRRNLVALALLLGCDYLPQGVAGVGREMALKLLAALKGVDLLRRFQQWRTDASLNSELSAIEKAVKRKTMNDKNFPNEEVINEFLSKKMYPKSVQTKAVCANLASVQEFCSMYLEWPQDYTREKVLPLITYWQMDNMDPLQTASPCTQVVRPQRILRERVQMKVECYEVLWQNITLGNSCSSSFVTIETRTLFKERFPAVVGEFEDQRRLKQTKSEKGKRKKDRKAPSSATLSDDEVEILALGMSSLSVAEKVESKRSGCLPEMEPGFTNGTEIAEDIFDNIRCSLDEFPGLKAIELNTLARNVPEYAKEDIDDQDFSSIKEYNELTEEMDDSFSFPSLAERLSKKSNLHGIDTRSLKVKSRMNGNSLGNAKEENSKFIATRESIGDANNKTSHTQNTETKLSPSALEETQTEANHFTFPKRHAMEQLSNNCDMQHLKENINCASTIDTELGNGDAGKNTRDIGLISPVQTDFSLCISSKGNLGDHNSCNYQVDNVELQTLQRSKELFLSTSEDIVQIMPPNTRSLVEPRGEPVKNEGKRSITHRVSESLFVSPLKERFKNEKSNIIDISSSSVDEVFAESSLQDNSEFLVSSLRERLMERVEKKKMSTLHSNNLLVDNNKENLKHGKVELSKGRSNQKYCSEDYKNKEAVSKEKNPSGKEEENLGRLIQENINAFVDIPQTEKLESVHERKRVRKKTIPRSQRKSCTDSPQEVDALQKRRVRALNKCRKQS